MEHTSATREAGDSLSFFTPRRLRQIAGKRSFDRGKAYFEDGAVRALRTVRDGVTAQVQGTYRYRVRLRVSHGEWDYDCDCPVGMDGGFCKHCVATALAWREMADSGSAAPAEGDIRQFLLGLDKEELASILLDCADEDERLHRRLTIRAAGAAPGAADLSVWRGAFDDALEAGGGYVPYGEAYEFARGVDEVIDTLEDLLRAGKASDVIELAEYGLDEADRSIEYIDDSDGNMSGILERLQELHLEACRQARPDPVELAERLFEAETESEYDIFEGAAGRYADVLGETGLAAHRRLVRAEWDQVPALGPDGENTSDYHGSRYRITSMMEAQARADGDFDLLVEIKTRNLSTPHAFLAVATLYKEAGDRDRALEWAERGWEAFPSERREEGLRKFLADEYQRRRRHGEAIALVWDAFESHPSLHTYAEVERRAGRAKQWPEWREKALALIRDRIAGEQAVPPPRTPLPWFSPAFRDHSLLVEILLHEGDGDAAWREAESGGCSTGLWLELAKRREETHPADSVRIYMGHIDTLLRNTGNHVYAEAVSYLKKMETVLDRAGDMETFVSYVANIRAAHKRKRNLMKMLDDMGW